MAAYFFFQNLEVTNPALLAAYAKQVGPVVAAYGGRYLAVQARVERVEGDWTPAPPVLIEFPSMEAARRFYASEDYRHLKKMRQTAGRFSGVLIDGL